MTVWPGGALCGQDGAGGDEAAPGAGAASSRDLEAPARSGGVPPAVEEVAGAPGHERAATPGPSPPPPPVAHGPAARPDRPAAPPRPEARPPVVDEPAVLGFSRHLRSRVGSRLFTWFFVLVFVLILVEMVASLLGP